MRGVTCCDERIVELIVYHFLWEKGYIDIFFRARERVGNLLFVERAHAQEMKRKNEKWEKRKKENEQIQIRPPQTNLLKQKFDERAFERCSRFTYERK